MKRYLIPRYLRDKYSLIATVTFTALFALVFILITIPYSKNVWFALGGSKAFSFTALFFIVSLLIVIISKRVMYATRAIPMEYWQYVLWNIVEILLIDLLYTAFSIQGDIRGIIDLQDTSAINIFLTSFFYCLIALGIPYLIAGMFFAIVDKNKTIRLMNLNDVVSDEPKRKSNNQKITLYDNSGVMKLSVSLSNLFYIESDDNYIIVWYSDSKGDLKKYMIRCRLKTVEESFKDSSLVRCHRKYIVNMDKVKVLRKEKDGYELDLENDEIPPITITKTYADNVLSRFNSK